MSENYMIGCSFSIILFWKHVPFSPLLFPLFFSDQYYKLAAQLVLRTPGELLFLFKIPTALHSGAPNSS
jgi:hypothetical protein